MPNLTPDRLRIVAEIAARHGFGREAALSVLEALSRGNGFQAQFQHPELGGMGQWSQGGMIMIGDMFNAGLKQRVAGLCNDLAVLSREQPPSPPTPGGGEGARLFAGSPGWWPAEFGQPASSGAQNDMRYAFFPGARRLALQQGGEVRVYDTGAHQLSGFSQQQGADRSLTFTSQHGPVRLADLAEISGERASPGTPSAASAPTGVVEDILKTIEGLAVLRRNGVLSEDEFTAKKSELLGRL